MVNRITAGRAPDAKTTTPTRTDDTRAGDARPGTPSRSTSTTSRYWVPVDAFLDLLDSVLELLDI